jgi:hypothetical protein
VSNSAITSVLIVGGAKENRTLFNLLNPSRFTLLFVGISDAPTLHAQISEKLALWHELIAGIQVEPPNSESDRKRFKDYLGSTPALLLIRPDGYIGFRGGEQSVSELADYCRSWLSPSERATPVNEHFGANDSAVFGRVVFKPSIPVHC